MNTNFASSLYSIYFPVNAVTGFTVGLWGDILKTTNSGTSWFNQASGTTADLYSVHFPVNTSTGYVVGDTGRILKTFNGGANWGRQVSSTTLTLYSVYFPVDNLTGYAVGRNGTILKTVDGGGVGVEEEKPEERGQKVEVKITAAPNPFTSFATIPGHSTERFSLYDISGHKVGTYKGDRVGVDLGPGVYFLRAEGKGIKPMRIVKVR
jgi:hypothetical protein